MATRGLTPRISRARRTYALRLAQSGKVNVNKKPCLRRRLHALGATRSLEIVPSNGTKDERQGRAVIDRLNLDN